MVFVNPVTYVLYIFIVYSVFHVLVEYIYSETGSSVNVLVTTTIGQQLDIIKLLLKNYFVNRYASAWC